jgi:hypothetical protein
MRLALISFFSKFRSKVDKNKEMILGKFESGARPGTWSNLKIGKLKFRCKCIIKEGKNKVKIDNFKISFIHCVLGLFVLNTKISLLNDFDHVTSKFFVFNKKSLNYGLNE